MTTVTASELMLARARWYIKRRKGGRMAFMLRRAALAIDTTKRP